MGCTVFPYLIRIASLTIIITAVRENETLSPQLFKHSSVGPLSWELNQWGLQLPPVVPKQLSYMYAAGNEHDCSCLHP